MLKSRPTVYNKLIQTNNSRYLYYKNKYIFIYSHSIICELKKKRVLNKEAFEERINHVDL